VLQHVVRSTVIDAPIDRVWAVLRDFNSHDRWHDVVAESRIEGDERSDQVGCVRSFALKDGNRIREQLLTLSDREYKSTYCIVEATVALQRYVATVTLKPVTDGDRTFWHWESTFATPPGQERELREMVARDVYEAGFENLRRYLRDGGDRRSASGAPLPTALPMASRQAVVRHYGSPDVLQPGDGEAAAPAAGEVRIRQRAIGVNYLDVYLRKGWIPAMLPLPGVPGMEAAGTVIDVGAGVSGVLPGDRVAYLGPAPGAYCSVRTVPAAWVVRLPAAVEDDVAAATLLKGITADYLLRDLGRVGPGTRLLVHAAAGGVGQIMVQWAKALGAVVIATVGSDAKAARVRELGADHVILYRDQDVAAEVKRITGGKGVPVAYDSVGKDTFEGTLKSLARRGIFVSYGNSSGPPPPVEGRQLMVGGSLWFTRPTMGDYQVTTEELDASAGALWDMIGSGKVKIEIGQTFPLTEARRAHEALASRSTIGASLLIP